MKHSESTYDIPEEISLKYYAVKNGRKPGIYKTWDECKAMVDKFPGAVYKSFKTLGEAKEYFGDTDPFKGELSEKNDAGAYAFVDGSFNKATATYGYGGYLFTGTEKIILQGNGCDPEMAAMRNVAGEILGSRAAIEKALELGIEKLSVYYDYMGIEMCSSCSPIPFYSIPTACFASLSASSFPSTPECPFTFTKRISILSLTD